MDREAVGGLRQHSGAMVPTDPSLRLPYPYPWPRVHKIASRGRCQAMRTLVAFVAVWIATWLLACADVRRRRINNYAGPYIAYGHRFTPCPSNGSMTIDIRVSHFNPAKPYQLQTISGNFTFNQPLDDSYSTRTDLAIWSANQWKQNAFLFNFPMQGCSSMRRHIPDFFRIVAKYTGASTDLNGPCVIPIGRSAFHDEPVNWSFPSFPVIMYGRYKFRETKWARSAKMSSFCLEVDCEVIPKP